MGMFDGVLNGIAGAGLNLIGGIMGNNMQTAQAAEANRFSAEQNANSMAFSAEQAQKQMDFQKEMRQTQYQTAVEDMKKAGINPMLAYSQGGAGNLSGASGSGASAVGQQATIHNPTSGMASSASTLANIRADLDMKEASTVESISRTGVNDEDRKLKNAQTLLTILESDKVPYQIKQIASQTLLQDAQRTGANAIEAANRMDTLIRGTGDLEQAKSKGKYYKTSPYNPYFKDDFLQGVNSAAGAASAIKGTGLFPGMSILLK